MINHCKACERSVSEVKVNVKVNWIKSYDLIASTYSAFNEKIIQTANIKTIEMLLPFPSKHMTVTALHSFFPQLFCDSVKEQ